MGPAQTHLEFESDKREAFTWWLGSKEARIADATTEFMLKEEFLQSITRKVITYLLDKQFETLTEVAMLAAGFETRHRTFHANGTPQAPERSGVAARTDKEGE